MNKAREYSIIHDRDMYLIHYNRNHYPPGPKGGQFAPSKLGGAVKSAGRSVGETLLRKKKKQPPKADIKSSPHGKQANTKLSKDERAHLVNNGSVAEVAANQDRLSNKELEFAINRLKKEKNDRMNLQKQLSDLGEPEAQSAIEKGAEYVEKAAKAGKSLKDYGEQAKTVWNFMADIHNTHASPDDKWFTFDKNGKPRANGPEPDIYDLVTKGSASEIMKNRDKLTLDQIKEWNNRQDELESVKKREASEKAEADKVEAAAKAAAQEKANKRAQADSIKRQAKEQKEAARQAAKEARKAKIAQEKQWRKDAKEAAKQRPTDRNDYDAYDKQLNSYEKEALREAKAQNREQARQEKRNREIPVQVYDPGDYGGGNTVSRNSFSTSYRPSQAVKDFVGIYYDQPIVAEVAGAAADIGYDYYKKRKNSK